MIVPDDLEPKSEGSDADEPRERDLPPPARFAHGATVRARELSYIRAVLARRREGALLIIGDEGSGKSRLLAAIGEIPGVAVRRIRISATEADVPLAGLSVLTAAFDDPAIETLSDVLLRTSTSSASAAALTAELISLIRAAGAQPTLMLVDDVHLLDEASTSVLSMMASRFGGTGVRLVVTANEPLREPLRSLPTLRLGPLDLAASTRLVRERTGRIADPALMRIITASSAGNARAIADIADRLSGDQYTRAEPLELPMRLHHRTAVETAQQASSRTDASRGSAGALLRRLSTAFLHGDEAIRSGDDEVDAALEELLSDGRVVNDGPYLRLADPLTRSTLYWSMGVADRRAVHAAAEEAEAGSEPGLALWHRSWRAPDDVSPAALVDHADRFARAGRIWQAVELAERGLTLASDRRALETPLFRLAQTLLLRGEIAFAERYERHCRRWTDPSRAPRLANLRILIECLSTWRFSSEHAEQSLIGDTESDDAATLLTTLATLHLLRWETDEARELLARAAQQLENASAETIELHRAVGVLRAATEGDPAPAASMLEYVSRCTTATVPSAESLVLLGRSLTYVDDEQGARRILRSVIDLEPAPDPFLVQAARYSLAELEIRAGNHFEASNAIDAAEAAVDDGEADRPLLGPLLAWRSMAGGREDAAERFRECHLRFGIHDPALAARLAAWQGQFELAVSHPAEATAHLRSAVTMGWPFRNPSLLRCSVDLIEAYTLADRIDDAFQHAREFFGRSSGLRTPWMLQARARAEALVTPGDRSLPLFQRAVALASPTELAFPRARTLLNLAERLADLGRRTESAEQYRAAGELFLHLGATAWLPRAEPRRAAEDAAPRIHPVLNRLTEDERQVVQLVRQGMRNREIAQELFISLRTVEVRLTRIYQRVGVTSRAHLISLLANSDRIA
jgi:DNA-binding CsgD family transcriptional regulator